MTSETDHYQDSKARDYDKHHQNRLRTRLTTWRERKCLYNALRDAGFPASALDLPCGTGRFWPVFARAGTASLIAGDNSKGMIEVAGGNRLSPTIPEQLIESSAFDIALPDDSVDFAACMRFYHHLARPEDRKLLLSELKRVSRRYVALSLWVDGNLPGNRRLRKPQPPEVPGYGRRRCRRRDELEAEFAAEGFRIVSHYDVWPVISMWRTYLLEHE